MKAPDQEHPCPLCGNADSYSFFVDKIRHYQRCSGCDLVFVSPRYWLSTIAEKATYDLHENSAEDPGYRCFLSRLSTPLMEKLETGQTGLDFGCGPGPALPAMLAEHGLRVDLYDPLYYNETAVFSKTYDFICATEVVEHLRDPSDVFSSLFRMLKPGGWLGIMTKLVIDQEAFSQWHYIRDLTHICFYSQSTYAYIARRFHAELDFVAPDVILMHKK